MTEEKAMVAMDAVVESKRNMEHFSAGAHVVMGIDEAGRGPVLGPMVYAGLVCPSGYEGSLKKIGFADSKTLKEDRRDDLFEKANADPKVAYFVHALSPELLSRQMLRVSKVNLNVISHNAAASLVARALEWGLIIDALWVDTVGDPNHYRNKLTRQFPSIPEVVVAAKADATYPAVSAASVVAKVTRDDLLRRWHFKESFASSSFSTAFGSGYPGDPGTLKWLGSSLDPIFGFPSVIRFSWKTCSSLLDKNAIHVDWPSHGGAQSTLDSAFKTPDRFKFFSGGGMDVVLDEL